MLKNHIPKVTVIPATLAHSVHGTCKPDICQVLLDVRETTNHEQTKVLVL